MYRLLRILFASLLLILGAATFIERSEGTVFVSRYVYHSLWFVGLWAMLAVVALIVVVRRRLWKRKAVALLHLSLLVILAGAATSFFTSKSDTMHSVRHDSIGTRLTYAGYLLLAASMLWVLCAKRERFRYLLRRVMDFKVVGVVAFLSVACATQMQARSLPTISAEEAEQMARRQIVYNGRIVPFNTMARDFMLKVYGQPEYHGLSAEQVVCGWLARPEVWKDEPLIKVKDGSLRRRLGANGEWVSMQSLFEDDGSYKIYALMKTEHSSKAVQEIDEKAGIILMLVQGMLFTPLPADAPSLSSSRVETEIFYNRMPLVKMLFMFNLTLGLLSLLAFIFGFFGRKGIEILFRSLFVLSLFVLSLLYALRWYVGGYMPLGNGYETMLFMSLAVMLVSAIVLRRFPLMACLGLLLSGFTLLVAHLGDANPQITPLAPALNSPLLSIHVSIIMMAYALLGMTFIISAIYFVLKILQSQRPSPHIARQLALLTPFSQLLLYPAVFLLAGGIFIGAVWANMAWGTYWSWDPKEVWALITMLVYVLPFHPSLTGHLLHTATRYHLFMMLAFLTILMTYFGVNYYLGGMHSYV